MPELTMMSAVCLTSASLTLQPNAFQSFQPIGGVRARPLLSASADAAVAMVMPVTPVATSASASTARRTDFMRIPFSFLGRSELELPLLVGAAVGGPADHGRALVTGRAVDIRDEAGGSVGQGVGTSGAGRELPLLAGQTGVRALVELGALSRARRLQRLAAVHIDDLVVAAADRDEAPVLVVAVVVGPLDHHRAVGRGLAVDVQRQPAVAVEEGVGRAGDRHRDQRPLLVRGRERRPLDHRGAFGGAAAADSGWQTSVAAVDLVSAVAVGPQLPLL